MDTFDGPPATTSRPSHASAKIERKIHRRDRNGCMTCRIRRRKCDGEKPSCQNCVKGGRVCIGTGYTFDVPAQPHQTRQAITRSSPSSPADSGASTLVHIRSAEDRPRSAPLSLGSNAKNLGYSLTDSTKLTEDRARCKELLTRFNHVRGELPEIFSRAGTQLCIAAPFNCLYGYNIVFGNGVRVGPDCNIQDTCSVEIHDNVVLDFGVSIICRSHPLEYELRRIGTTLDKPVVIEDDVWIGPKSVIMPGVTIGRRSVVAAGSIVSKDVPDDSFVLGSILKIQSRQGNLMSK